MSSKQLNVAILGAGPGGLTLASILRQHSNIKCTVFESEPSIDSRSQGGCFDLHPESGQKALIAANLWDQVKSLLRYEGQDTKVLDIAGNVHFSTNEEDFDRPEIDRRELRKLLINSLESGTIQWGYHLQRVVEQKEGGYELQFQNGKIESNFDLIVGADGAWSKVRSALTDQKPQYSGMSSIGLRISNIKERFPEIDSLIGRGMAMVLAPGEGMLFQQNGDKSAASYLCKLASEDWLKTLDFSTPQIARETMLEFCKDWDEAFKNFVKNCDDEIIPRPLYELPIGHKWEHKKGITIIGDAAHLMTPFAGEGANMAMQDALELAEAILQNREDLDQGVKQFEEAMWKRAGKAAAKTRAGLDMMFAKDAPFGTVNFFKSMIPPTAYN